MTNIEVLVRQRTEDSYNHAEWAGMALAECVVARHLDLKKLSPVKIEKMRKRYHVAPEFLQVMLRSAQETIASEKSWQFSHS